MLGFESMLGELKAQAADKWGFWKKTLEELGGTDEDLLIFKSTEPILLKTINKYQIANNKGEKIQKNMMLVVKCRDSVVRYELHRSKLMLMEALNKNMPEGEKVVSIVFR